MPYTFIKPESQFWHCAKARAFRYFSSEKACGSVKNTGDVCGRIRILKAKFREINLGVPEIATNVHRSDIDEFGTWISDAVQQELCKLLLQVVGNTFCAAVLLRQIST